eukprot:922555-Prymnesium_polylepis.1
MSVLLAALAAQAVPCFNSSNCPYPQVCIIEGDLRRYCTYSIDDLAPGRTLFKDSALDYKCDSCDAPLALVDFSSLADARLNDCVSACDLPSN